MGGLAGGIVDDGAVEAVGDLEAVLLVFDSVAGGDGVVSAAGTDLEGVDTVFQRCGEAVAAAGDGLAVEADGGAELIAVLQTVGGEGEGAVRRGVEIRKGYAVAVADGDNDHLTACAVVDRVALRRSDGVCAVAVKGANHDGVGTLGELQEHAGGGRFIVEGLTVQGDGEPQHLKLRLQMADGEGVAFVVHHVAVDDAGLEVAIRVADLGTALCLAGAAGGQLTAGAAAAAADVHKVADAAVVRGHVLRRCLSGRLRLLRGRFLGRLRLLRRGRLLRFPAERGAVDLGGAVRVVEKFRGGHQHTGGGVHVLAGRGL